MKSGRNWGRLGMIYKSINEIADVTKLAGFEFTKHIKYIENGEIIALRALNLRDGHLDLKDIKRIDKSVSEQLTRSKLYKNDIVISYTGTIGECAQIHENDKYHLAPNVAKITPNPIFVNPQYLFHYIRSSMFRNQMYNYCHGSTQPTIPMKTIRELSIPIFPLETQKQIASILSALDDKIELNNRINENLEQQAQAIFKSWFVDFEPFGGVIPEDWNKCTLDSICSLISKGVTPKYIDCSEQIVINQKCIRNHKIDLTFARYHIPKKINEKWLKHGDILINSTGTGTLGRAAQVLFAPKNLTVDSHVTIVRAKKTNYQYYLGVWAISHECTFEKMQTGSTSQTDLPRELLKQMEILLPSDEILNNYSSIIKPIFDMMVANQQEINRLAELRDTLLPKLMNGEIDVSKVKI